MHDGTSTDTSTEEQYTQVEEQIAQMTNTGADAQIPSLAETAPASPLEATLGTNDYQSTTSSLGATGADAQIPSLAETAPANPIDAMYGTQTNATGNTSGGTTNEDASTSTGYKVGDVAPGADGQMFQLVAPGQWERIGGPAGSTPLFTEENVGKAGLSVALGGLASAPTAAAGILFDALHRESRTQFPYGHPSEGKNTRENRANVEDNLSRPNQHVPNPNAATGALTSEGARMTEEELKRERQKALESRGRASSILGSGGDDGSGLGVRRLLGR